jgi:hypothetical protein
MDSAKMCTSSAFCEPSACGIAPPYEQARLDLGHRRPNHGDDQRFVGEVEFELLAFHRFRHHGATVEPVDYAA